MFVAFLGCDGSGKSAVIAEVCRILGQQGVPVERGHWRPVAIEAGQSPAAQADDPHGQQPRGSLGSVAKLGWLWINWWLGWRRSLAGASRRGVVIFDRYHADLLVDPRRYRYGGPMFVAEVASNTMPQPDRVFFLDADPDILLSRKQEVDRASLERSRTAYLCLAKRYQNIRIIDASQPLKKVVADVMEGIRGSI